jgi:hypothetical protein
LVRSNSAYDATAFSRLWIHESTRVIGDRLVNNQDIEAFQGVLKDLSKKYLGGNQEKILEEPVIFTNFADSTEAGDFTDYIQVTTFFVKDFFIPFCLNFKLLKFVDSYFLFFYVNIFFILLHKRICPSIFFFLLTNETTILPPC